MNARRGWGAAFPLSVGILVGLVVLLGLNLVASRSEATPAVEPAHTSPEAALAASLTERVLPSPGHARKPTRLGTLVRRARGSSESRTVCAPTWSGAPSVSSPAGFSSRQRTAAG